MNLGLPTRTEQADLEFVLHSGHGDLLRLGLVPLGSAAAGEVKALCPADYLGHEPGEVEVGLADPLGNEVVVVGKDLGACVGRLVSGELKELLGLLEKLEASGPGNQAEIVNSLVDKIFAFSEFLNQLEIWAYDVGSLEIAENTIDKMVSSFSLQVKKEIETLEGVKASSRDLVKTKGLDTPLTKSVKETFVRNALKLKEVSSKVRQYGEQLFDLLLKKEGLINQSIDHL